MHDGTLHSPIGGDDGAAANLALTVYLLRRDLSLCQWLIARQSAKIVPEPFPNTFTINTDSAITQFWIMVDVHPRQFLTYRSFLGSSRSELISEPESQ